MVGEIERKAKRAAYMREWSRKNYPLKRHIWKKSRDKYRAAHPDRRAAQRRAYREKYREQINAKKRMKSENDPFVRMKSHLRRHVWRAFKKGSWRKKSKSTDILGADFATVRAWIEAQFKPGMAWKNYGEWHIDHIIPVCAAKNRDELLAVLKFKNLQPLWAIENMKKSGKIPIGWAWIEDSASPALGPVRQSPESVI